MDLSTADYLSLNPDISRDTFYGILRGPRSKSVRSSKGKNRRPQRSAARHFSQRETEQIFRAIQAIRMGFNPKLVREAMTDAKKLRNEKQIQFGAALTDVFEKLCCGADDGDLWDAVAVLVCGQLECEYCQIHFYSGQEERITSVFACTSQGATQLDSRQVIDLPKAWEEHASGGQAINLFRETLENDDFAKSYVGTRRCFSMMALPIHYFTARKLCGWIVAENRLAGPTLVPNATSCFDYAVEEVGKIVARVVSLVANVRSYHKTLQDLIQEMQKHHSMEQFVRIVLDRARELTGAHRGDGAWVTEPGQLARVVAQSGPSRLLGKIPFEVGAPISTRSVTRRVIETGEAKCIEDVTTDADYCECDSATKSELCVPVKGALDEHPIGAINIESITLRAFNERDKFLLEKMAKFAALYGHIVENRDAMTTQVSDVLGENFRPREFNPILNPNRILKKLLEEIGATFPFNQGIAYLVDYRTAEFYSVAVKGYHGGEPKIDEFLRCKRPIGDQSLPATVFRARDLYVSVEQAARPNEPDYHLERDFRELFRIKGPIIGLPLLLGTAVIGAIALWSNKKDVTVSQPSETLKRQLRQYAKFAVTSLELAQVSNKRQLLLKSVRDITCMIMAKNPAEDILHKILKALTASDFERARVFQIDKDNNLFYCRDSLSVYSGEKPLKGTRVYIQKSPYARETTAMSRGAWRAVKFDPKCTHGEDPYASKLGKPPLLPFAVGLLYIGDDLKGYLACDNSHSRREITAENLESLETFVVLAAQAVAVMPPPPPPKGDGEDEDELARVAEKTGASPAVFGS